MCKPQLAFIFYSNSKFITKLLIKLTMHYYVGRPVVKAVASGGCQYIHVRWSTGSSEMCRVIASVVVLSYYSTGQRLHTRKVINSKSYTFTGLPSGTLFAVTVYVSRTVNVTGRNPSYYTYARTDFLQSTCIANT